MSRASILIAIGLCVILIAFSGLPLKWVRFILPVFGLAVVVIGFLMRGERIAALKREMPTPPETPLPNDLSPIS